MFSARIVTVDSCQSFPVKGHDVCYSEFRGSEVYKVPVIRVFGITPAGQKACVHIHGVFPYLSIRCKDVFPNNEFKSHGKYLQELTLDVDKALNVAARNSNSHRHHIYKIISVRKIPFYGYHEEKEDFLRIYFYNPFDVSRTAELLTNGVIMNKFIQPYEAHIPYILQFFIDYNLFGMNLLNISTVKFRASEESFIAATSPLRSLNSSLLSQKSTCTNNKVWAISQLHSSQISDQKKQTSCELEADCCESDILNRLEGSSCAGKNPGLLSIWEDEKQRRRALYDTSQITPVPSQERNDEKETESEIFFKSRLKKILEYYQKQYLYNYEVLLNEEKKGLTDYSMKHSSSLNMSNAEDEEILNMLLSMADSQPGHLDEDSILAICGKNKTDDEIEDDETFEMSQLFVEEFGEDVLSLQNVSENEHQISVEFSKRTSMSRFKDYHMNFKADSIIPQLDGATDEEYEKLGSKLLSDKKPTELGNNIDVDDICDSPPILLPITPLEFDSDESTKEISQISPKLDKYLICDKMQFSIHPSKFRLNDPYVPDNAERIPEICKNTNEDSCLRTICDAIVLNEVKVPIVTQNDDLSELISELLSKMISEIEIANGEKQSFTAQLGLNAKTCGSKSSKIIQHQKKVPILPLPLINNQNSFLENKNHTFAKEIQPDLSSNIKFRTLETREMPSLTTESKTLEISADSCDTKNTTSIFDGNFNLLSLDFSKIGKEVVLVKKLTNAEMLASDIDLHTFGTFLRSSKRFHALEQQKKSLMCSKYTKINQENKHLKQKDKEEISHLNNKKSVFRKQFSKNKKKSSRDPLCLSLEVKEEKQCFTEDLVKEQIVPPLRIKVEEEDEIHSENIVLQSILPSPSLCAEDKIDQAIEVSVLNKSQFCQSKVKTHLKNMKETSLKQEKDIFIAAEKEQKLNHLSTITSAFCSNNRVIENSCKNNTKNVSEQNSITRHDDVDADHKSVNVPPNCSLGVKLKDVFNVSESLVNFLPVVKLERFSSKQIEKYCANIPESSSVVSLSSGRLQKEENDIIDETSSNVCSNFQNDIVMKNTFKPEKNLENAINVDKKESSETLPQNEATDKSSCSVDVQLQTQKDVFCKHSLSQSSDCASVKSNSYSTDKSPESVVNYDHDIPFSEPKINMDSKSKSIVVPSSKLKVVLTPLSKDYYNISSSSSNKSHCQMKSESNHKLNSNNEQQNSKVVIPKNKLRSKLSLKLNKKTLNYQCSSNNSHLGSFHSKIDNALFNNQTEKSTVENKNINTKQTHTYFESENTVSLRNYRLKSQRKSKNLFKTFSSFAQNEMESSVEDDVKVLEISSNESSFKRNKLSETLPSASRNVKTKSQHDSTYKKNNYMHNEKIQSNNDHKSLKQSKHDSSNISAKISKETQNINLSDVNESALLKLKVPDVEGQNDFQGSYTKENVKSPSANTSLNLSVKPKTKSHKYQYNSVINKKKLLNKVVKSNHRLKVCEPNEIDFKDTKCRSFNKGKNINNNIVNEHLELNQTIIENEGQPNSVKNLSPDIPFSVKIKTNGNFPESQYQNLDESNVESVQNKPKYQTYNAYTSTNVCDKSGNEFLTIQCSSARNENDQLNFAKNLSSDSLRNASVRTKIRTSKCERNNPGQKQNNSMPAGNANSGHQHKIKPNKNKLPDISFNDSKHKRKVLLNVKHSSAKGENDVLQQTTPFDNIPNTSVKSKTKLHKSKNKTDQTGNRMKVENVLKYCEGKIHKLSEKSSSCSPHTVSGSSKNTKLFGKDMSELLKVYDLDVEGDNDFQTNGVKTASSNLSSNSTSRMKIKSYQQSCNNKTNNSMTSLCIKKSSEHKVFSPSVGKAKSVSCKKMKSSKKILMSCKKSKSKSKSHRHLKKIKKMSSNLEKNFSSNHLKILEPDLHENIIETSQEPKIEINPPKELSDSKITEGSPQDSKQQLKMGLKMKFKIRRISTRSKETRIVVVEKKLEGFDDDDSKISEPSNEENIYDEQNLKVPCETDTLAFVAEKPSNSKKSLGNRNMMSFKTELNPRDKFKSPLLLNITNDSDKPFKKRIVANHHVSKSNTDLTMQDGCFKTDCSIVFKQKDDLLSPIEKDLLSDCKSPKKLKKCPENVNISSRKKLNVKTEHKTVDTKSISPYKLSKCSDKLSIKFSDFVPEKPVVCQSSTKILMKGNRYLSHVSKDNEKNVHCQNDNIQSLLTEDEIKKEPIELNETDNLWESRFRERKQHKIANRRNSLLCQNFKKYFESDSDDDCKIISENIKGKSQHFLVDNPLQKCKPCEVKLNRISLDDIKKYEAGNKKIFRKNLCPELKVLSVPSPITDIKNSSDFSVETSKILENLFNFPTACNSPFKSKIESPIMVENDRSLDSMECDIYSLSATNSFENDQYRKPENVFAKIEREDMGVLWNLSYLSPIDSNNGYESPPRCYSPVQAKKFDTYEESLCCYSPIKQTKVDNCEKNLKSDIKAENTKSVEAECELNYSKSMSLKEELTSFKINVEGNLSNKETFDTFRPNDCGPNERNLPNVDNHSSGSEEVDEVSSKQSILLLEKDSANEQNTLNFEKDVMKESSKDLNDCVNNSGFESDCEKTLPNVRILDFQECLLESDTEMNPLISEIEAATIEKSAENDILSKINDNYELNMKMETEIDEFQTLEEKSLSLPLINQLSNQKCSQGYEFPKQAEINSGMVYNAAVITAADTSSIPYSAYKDNPVPILAIGKPDLEENICFSEYDTQNYKTADQTFFPIIVTDEAIIENGAFFENNPMVVKENSSNMQECINFFESNELLQSCSVSSTSDVEVKVNHSNPIGNPFNGEEDILSMIVKSCDICEEFDGNSTEQPDENYVVVNETCPELNLEQNVLPNETEETFLSKGFFHVSHENAVSSSSENVYFSDNAIAECSEFHYAKKVSSDSQQPQRTEICEEQKGAFELETEDNFLLDSMIHSFYGEDTLYGLHSSDNFGNLSYCSDVQSSFQETQYSGSKEASNGEKSDISDYDKKVSHHNDINSLFHSPAVSATFPSTPCGYIEHDNRIEKSLKSPNLHPLFRNIQLELIAIDSDQRVDTFLSSSTEEIAKLIENFVIVKPKLKPPSRNDVLNWIKTNTKNEGETRVPANEGDQLDEVSLSSDGSDSEPHAYTTCKLDLSIQGSQSLLHNVDSPMSHLMSNLSKLDHSNKPLNYPILHKMLSDTNHSVSEAFKLESTPSASTFISRSFHLNQLVVSPIKNEKLLTSGTKQRKRKLFEENTSVQQQKKFCFEQKIDEIKALNNSSNNRIQLNVSKDSAGDESGIEGPTLENSKAFKVCFDGGEARARHEVQYLTIMSLEMHVNTRNDLKPDPKFDAVTAVFYSVCNDVGVNKQEETVGLIVVDPVNTTSVNCNKNTRVFKNYLDMIPGSKNYVVFCVESEVSLFEKLVKIVHDWDPDILIGYEIQMSSWGYLIERANILNINLNVQLSRLIDKNESKILRVEEDYTVIDQTAELNKINIIGRIVLCIWRLMRKEINLNVYSFENVYYHVLHRRTPLYTFHDLTNWFLGSEKEKVLRYYVIRVEGSIQFLEKLDIISRTSELARLFGIQFYEVLSRGSQFRVESMMLRSASSLSYIPVSPSVRQRSHARAPECLALILEPESRFYVDPVVVLDFQSLYPSMIIAYNYCFSTCLGRVEHFGKDVPFEFGCTTLKTPTSLLTKLENNIHISPTGIAFVKSAVRHGILPQMLEEILNTRVMVKQSMKKVKDNLALKKLLDARQLGLKLIANVTYGYTGANFSGRMPCVEVADSIVGKARETLERAIHLIENTSTWKAKVVYGDTDSIFILLTGRSKEQAFQIGQEIAEAVTAMNPKPVKLKFEKVYLPCVLQTKKRYVGYMYETIDQKKPTYDAKGIETVRRDSCPATAKILEKSLKILFETYDVDAVKKYVQKQFTKILNGRASIIDYIFAKEYRGITGYRPGACVPALQIAKKRLSKDPRAEPRVGERVPYVIVYGFPGVPIIQLVREPSELLNDLNLRINATYYITRVITPPLERVFNLVGVEVKTWYTNLARTFKPTLPITLSSNHHKGTISQYFATLSCPSCGKSTYTSLCDACRQDAQGTTVILNDKIRLWERASANLNQVCSSCSKYSSSAGCVSIDCPVLFKVDAAKKELSQAPYLRKILAHELF